MDIKGANNFHIARPSQESSGLFSKKDPRFAQAFAKAISNEAQPSRERKVAAPIDEHTFASVTRYLPGCGELLEQAGPQEVDALCENLQKGDWSQIIAGYRQNCEALAIHALKAFQEGKICVSQFSTLFFCYFAMQEFVDIQLVSLFHKYESVNRIAQNYIDQTLESCAAVEERFGDFLVGAKKKAFFEGMKKQPLSEQYFFVVEKELSDDSITVTESIHTRIGINVFGCFVSKDGLLRRMIPSFSMMQQFLFAQNASNAVTITPVIGLSSVADIYKNAQANTRDMALPGPGIDLPKTADHYSAPKYEDFKYHDFYHAIIASFIPKKFKCALVACADVVNELKTQFASEFSLRFLEKFYEVLIDMEHTDFMTDTSDINTFFRSFQVAIETTFGRFLAEDRGSFDQQDLYIYTEIQYHLLRRSQIIEILAAILYKRRFCEKYGISSKDLETTAIAELLKEKETMENGGLFLDVEGESILLAELERKNRENCDKVCLSSLLAKAYKEACH